MSALYIIWFFIGSVAMSIWFHELGHYLYFFKVLKKKVKINVKRSNTFGFSIFVGESKDYVGLLDKEYVSLCAWGVLAGLVPIIILLKDLIVLNIFWFVFLIYVLGSVNDLAVIIKYLRR